MYVLPVSMERNHALTRPDLSRGVVFMPLTPPKLTRVTSGGSVVLKHRESLTMPNDKKTSAATQPSNVLMDFIAYPVDDDNDESTYNGWMNQFCIEPGDCNALAEAIFVPCVLYGKIEWRRARLSKNLSADDSYWRASDGCNGMCWAYYIVSHFGIWHSKCPLILTLKYLLTVFSDNGLC